MEESKKESLKATNLSSVLVSASDLGKIIGVTDRRVRQLAEEGILVRSAKGRYGLMESLKNYILTIKIAAESKESQFVEGEVELEEEKALHERVKRHISELKFQTMNGELHKSSDVERVMTDMLLSVKTKLLGLPSKLAPLLLNQQEVGVIKDSLTKEILELLNELKEYNPTDFYGEEYIEIGGEIEENER